MSETAVEILARARGQTFCDEDGERWSLELVPSIGEGKVVALEEQLGRALPAELRELFLYCGGFEGTHVEVDLTGSSDCGSDIFPGCLPIAGDGFGNFWVVDLDSSDPSDTAVFYICHDPPVVVFQAESIARFISESLFPPNRGEASEIDRVHDECAMEIWGSNPKVCDFEKALASDEKFRAFAESLDSSYLFIDLRKPDIGDGFSWGRYGADTVSKRFASERIFAYQIKKLSWIQKMFGV